MERVRDAEVFTPPYVLTADDARFIVGEQLAAIGVTAEIVLEPARRDSAIAIAVATLQISRDEPEGLVLVLAADHVVGDTPAFVEAMLMARAGAQACLIMTLGVPPTSPSSAYGYIQPGTPVDGGTWRVERFVEKPSAGQAADLIREGALWNSGYFLFRADVMLEELARYAPDVLMAARAALDSSIRDLGFLRLHAAAFDAAPKISIDHAVMEHTDRAGLLPVSFAWSDIGTWGALWAISQQDEAGNALRGRVMTMRTSNSLVHSEDNILTTVVGLDDVVVVASPDAVLVTSRAAAGDVKDLVASLRERGESEADAHRRIYRPWGSYERTDIGARFQVKRITVKPDAHLSLQKHHHRAEHWVVVRGTAQVTVDERVWLVHENEAAYIPIGATHRLANPGKIPLELVEVQVGSYTGEDDIIRVEDIYGR